METAFLKPAPTFELFDQKSRLVKLDAFLHRHPILIVFFDGAAGPDASETLRKLRDYYPALKENDVVVLAVSTFCLNRIGPAGNRFLSLSCLISAEPHAVRRTGMGMCRAT